MADIFFCTGFVTSKNEKTFRKLIKFVKFTFRNNYIQRSSEKILFKRLKEIDYNILKEQTRKWFTFFHFLSNWRKKTKIRGKLLLHESDNLDFLVSVHPPCGLKIVYQVHKWYCIPNPVSHEITNDSWKKKYLHNPKCC